MGNSHVEHERRHKLLSEVWAKDVDKMKVSFGNGNKPESSI